MPKILFEGRSTRTSQQRNQRKEGISVGKTKRERGNKDNIGKIGKARKLEETRKRKFKFEHIVTNVDE